MEFFANECVRLPAIFDDNRIFLTVESSAGPLKFYTDSGGGLWPFVYDDAADKLGMTVEKTETDGEFKFGLSSFPSFFAAQNIPLKANWQHHVRVFPYTMGGSDELSQSRVFLGDGFFGASFFADGIWKFDYPNQILAACSASLNVTGMSAVPMYFKNLGDERLTHQPRIEIEVSGVKLFVLFDTGATSALSKEARQTLSKDQIFMASSFIRKSVAQTWLQQNPQWKVIKGGDRFSGGTDLIEVPEVILAGHKVGPVWFAMRDDEMYDKYSAEAFDARIDGAVGGNILRFFEIVADYPAAMLYVKKAN